MKKIVFRFGIMTAALLLLLQLAQLTIFTRRIAQEIWIILFAGLFLAFGWWLSQYFRKDIPVESPIKPNDPPLNLEVELKAKGISEREYEVLQLISKGLSNQEIAKQLFIAESTVKTHVSSLLVKLDARRRTQAVDHARQGGLL